MSKKYQRLLKFLSFEAKKLTNNLLFSLVFICLFLVNYSSYNFSQISCNLILWFILFITILFSTEHFFAQDYLTGRIDIIKTQGFCAIIFYIYQNFFYFLIFQIIPIIIIYHLIILFFHIAYLNIFISAIVFLLSACNIAAISILCSALNTKAQLKIILALPLATPIIFCIFEILQNPSNISSLMLLLGFSGINLIICPLLTTFALCHIYD